MHEEILIICKRMWTGGVLDYCCML